MGNLIEWLQRRPNSILFKLLSGFLLISVALLILVIVIILTLQGVGNHITQVSTDTQTVSLATNLRSDIESAQGLIYQLRLNLDNPPPMQNLKGSISNYEASLQQVTNKLKQALEDANGVSGNLIDPVEMANFKAVLTGPFADLIDTLSVMIKDIKADNVQDALAKYNSLKANQATFDQIQTTLSSLTPLLDSGIEQTRAEIKNAVEEANVSRSSTESILIVASLLIVVLALSLGVFLTRIFSLPIERLRNRFLSLAEGDFVTPLVVANRDQFGELATTFNQSIARLGQVLDLLQTQSLKVSSAAAQIAATSRQSATLSAEQAGSVSEVAVTVEELSNTAQQIAEAASLVSEAAEQALASADGGQDTLNETIEGINSLKARVQDIAVKILALTERSQQVGHVIEQINSIAEEIHLLALNAAIESAAAGENGKRFAVVAAKVKQLADKSRNATREVQTVLSEIQAATNASVMATEQGMKEAERGVNLVHKGGDANESIIQAVERTVQLASAISLATQQQRSASEQVVSTMQQLTTIIQDGATSSRQSSSLAVELDEIANQLKQISGQFKVETSKNSDDGSTDDTNLTKLPSYIRPRSNAFDAGDGSSQVNWHPELV